MFIDLHKTYRVQMIMVQNFPWNINVWIFWEMSKTLCFELARQDAVKQGKHIEEFSLFSCESDDRLSDNTLHRFVILCTCWLCPTNQYTGLCKTNVHNLNWMLDSHFKREKKCTMNATGSLAFRERFNVPFFFLFLTFFSFHLLL